MVVTHCLHVVVVSWTRCSRCCTTVKTTSPPVASCMNTWVGGKPVTAGGRDSPGGGVLVYCLAWYATASQLHTAKCEAASARAAAKASAPKPPRPPQPPVAGSGSSTPGSDGDGASPSAQATARIKELERAVEVFAARVDDANEQVVELVRLVLLLRRVPVRGQEASGPAHLSRVWVVAPCSASVPRLKASAATATTLCKRPRRCSGCVCGWKTHACVAVQLTLSVGRVPLGGGCALVGGRRK